ncbi:MAG TPA: DsbA family protein, partial [Bordetella sp.]|nr:DsbA family protein [Bordetella sp.]
LFDKKAMGDWLAEQGVDRAKFDSIFDSFSVQTQVQRADQLAQIYNIDGTPAFGVGGKFLTSPAMAGNSYEGALQQVDKLIPMARQQ